MIEKDFFVMKDDDDDKAAANYNPYSFQVIDDEYINQNGQLKDHEIDGATVQQQQVHLQQQNPYNNNDRGQFYQQQSPFNNYGREIVKNEKYHTTTYSISPLISELENTMKKKCCVCDYEYPIICNETEIHNHVKNCLSTVNLDNLHVSDERIQLDCPFCDKKLLNNGDITDLEHLTMCCSQLYV
ncbi:unnamed protein product [Rotaria sordida]|uniref:Uncharacterized protein n=1 Tax=Rotaria sordida TaxID=392033 RepID=A0A815KW78_9BILA|nr:unnamed protein product [Rotaria sordida]